MGSSQLNPGGMGAPNLQPDQKPGEFQGSMAEAIENAFFNLLAADGMRTFERDTDSNDARDRRRLMVAIAQGVVRHLVDNPGAFQITFVDAFGNTITASVSISFDSATLLANT